MTVELGTLRANRDETAAKLAKAEAKAKELSKAARRADTDPTESLQAKQKVKKLRAALADAEARLEVAAGGSEAAASPAKKDKKRKREEKEKKKEAAAADGEGGDAMEEDARHVSASTKKEEEAEEEGDKPRKAKALKAGETTPEQFRAVHDIHVPAGAPAPYQQFTDAPFPEALQAALLGQGYAAPTPIQAQSWPVAIGGKDLIAIAKTGSGKTAGFMLPALIRVAQEGSTEPPRSERTAEGFWRTEAIAPRVLVIAPTRELAQQIGAEAIKFSGAANAKVVVLYGGAPKTEQIHAMRKGADCVVATPGRLEDFLKPQNGRDPLITVSHATYVVLDEADRMLDMGFEPSIKAIMDMTPQSGRQTLMFSATWPKEVQRIAKRYTSASAVMIRIGNVNSDKLTCNPNVQQTVEFMREDEKQERLVQILKSELPQGERAIIFAGTKRRCEELNRDLYRAGFKTAGAIHGDKDQWEREQALGKFKTGKAAVLCATDVAARGLDIPDVKAVVVFDLGSSIEDYVHRIGRTGRAGATGRSFAFVTRNNADVAREFCTLLADAKVADVPRELTDLAAAQKGKGGGNNRSRWGGGGGGRGRGGRGGGRGRGGRGRR